MLNKNMGAGGKGIEKALSSIRQKEKPGAKKADSFMARLMAARKLKN